MNKLTLKDLLDLYNFRNYRSEIEIESLRYDTSIIRIYLDEKISSHKYIEFGIYDFSEEEYKEEIYNEFINENTLKRKITSLYYDDNLSIFCIVLGDKENE